MGGGDGERGGGRVGEARAHNKCISNQKSPSPAPLPVHPLFLSACALSLPPSVSLPTFCSLASATCNAVDPAHRPECMHAVCVRARARTCVCARACVRACTHRERRYLRWRGLELAHAIGVRVGGVLRQLPGEVLEDFAKAGRLLLRGLLNTNGHRVLSGGRGAQRAALSLYARERARLTSSCMASRTRPARCGARAARGRPTPWRASAGAAVKAAEPARQAASTATQSARRVILFSNFFVTEFFFFGARDEAVPLPCHELLLSRAKQKTSRHAVEQAHQGHLADQGETARGAPAAARPVPARRRC